MKTLLLLRHGKAVTGEAGDDHDRALNDRGRAQARAVGELLERIGLVPDLVIASDARRTRETAALAFAEGDPPVSERPDLYAASADEILGIVQGTAPDVRCLLVVGHNPGIGELARLLAGTGEPQALIELQQGFATASLAALAFHTESWTAVSRSAGALTRFLHPDPMRQA